MPFSFRHRPPPNCLRNRARSRTEGPRAILSTSLISLMTSKFTQSIIPRRTNTLIGPTACGLATQKLLNFALFELDIDKIKLSATLANYVLTFLQLLTLLGKRLVLHSVRLTLELTRRRDSFKHHPTNQVKETRPHRSRPAICWPSFRKPTDGIRQLFDKHLMALVTAKLPAEPRLHFDLHIAE